jgi:hypothetical protein
MTLLSAPVSSYSARIELIAEAACALFLTQTPTSASASLRGRSTRGAATDSLSFPPSADLTEREAPHVFGQRKGETATTTQMEFIHAEPGIGYEVHAAKERKMLRAQKYRSVSHHRNASANEVCRRALRAHDAFAEVRRNVRTQCFAFGKRDGFVEREQRGDDGGRAVGRLAQAAIWLMRCLPSLLRQLRRRQQRAPLPRHALQCGCVMALARLRLMSRHVIHVRRDRINA